MPRRSRSISTEFVHSMSQGINKEYIFKTDKDKSIWLKTMCKYTKKYNIQLISYCTMENHVHILTYSKQPENISKLMKEVNGSYATYYNKDRNRVGYVFRNRFESRNIATKNQLYRCIKYIHMNPVKANIVNNEGDYKFSSYNDFINKTGIINTDILKLIFNSENNYLEKFYSIEDNPKDIKIEMEGDLENFINEFVQNNNINKEDIIENQFFMKKLFESLEKKWGDFDIKELSLMLGCDSKKIYREKSRYKL